MTVINQPDTARLFLRLGLGFLVLFHGIGKLINGIGPVEDLLAAHGLPVMLAHQHELLALKANGGWAIELPMLFLLNGIVVALLGPGRFRIHS